MCLRGETTRSCTILIYFLFSFSGFKADIRKMDLISVKVIPSPKVTVLSDSLSCTYFNLKTEKNIPMEKFNFIGNYFKAPLGVQRVKPQEGVAFC